MCDPDGCSQPLHSFIECATSLNYHHQINVRYDLIRTAKLCAHCFNLNHATSNCPSKSCCRTRGSKHHTLLYFEKKKPSIPSEPTYDANTIQTSEPVVSDTPGTITWSAHIVHSAKKFTPLATIVVNFTCGNPTYLIRIMFDDCTQTTLT